MTADPAFTLADFLDLKASKNVTESTLGLYRYQLGQVERWLGRPLGAATKRNVLDLNVDLRKRTAGPQYSKLMRMFYHAAGRDDLADLCVLEQRTHRLSPDEILTPKEIQALLEAAISLRDRALIAVLWETGVRISEACALRMKDVQLDDSRERPVYILWFHTVKVAGEEHQGFVIEGARVLKEWIEAHPFPRKDSLLFPTWGGHALERGGGYQVVRAAAKRAGIEKRVYPHLFRHSRATYLLRRGTPEAQVKKLLGWKPGSLMLARYSHLANADARRAAEKVAGMEPGKDEAELDTVDYSPERLKPIVAMEPPPGMGLRELQLEFQKAMESDDPNVADLLLAIHGVLRSSRRRGPGVEGGKPSTDGNDGPAAPETS